MEQNIGRFCEKCGFRPPENLVQSQKSDDEHSADMQLVSIYKSGKRDVMVPAELMESRGTLKLLDLAIPFETLFTRGGIFVRDEFDAAIHPELIKGIIALFNKGYKEDGFAERVFHLHLRNFGDHDELYFRDYLNDHPEVAKQYENLKLSLWKPFEYDRDGYTKMKTDFVQKYTQMAVEKYDQGNILMTKIGQGDRHFVPELNKNK